MSQADRNTNESRRLKGAGWIGLGAVNLFLAVLSWGQMDWNFARVRASLSFRWFDGHCTPAQSLLGHCFGDFAEFVARPAFADAAISRSIYPPFHQVALLAATTLVSTLGYLATLSLLGATMCVAVGFVMWRASDRFSYIYRIGLLVLFGFATLPFVASLDRGNTAILALPFIYLFFRSVQKDESWMAAFWLALASQIRPQFALLVVVFVLLRHPRALVRCVAAVSGTYFLGFLLTWIIFADSPLDWARRVLSYRDFLPLSNYPANVAFARYSVGLNESLFSNDPMTISAIRAYWYELPAGVHQMVLILTGCSILLVATYSRRPSIDDSLKISVIVFLAFPQYAHAYFLLVLIPLIAYLIKYGKQRAVDNFHSLSSALGFLGIFLGISLIIIEHPNDAVYLGYNISSEASLNLAPVIATGLLVASLLLFVWNLKEFHPVIRISPIVVVVLAIGFVASSESPSSHAVGSTKDLNQVGPDSPIWLNRSTLGIQLEVDSDYEGKERDIAIDFPGRCGRIQIIVREDMVIANNDLANGGKAVFLGDYTENLVLVASKNQLEIMTSQGTNLVEKSVGNPWPTVVRECIEFSNARVTSDLDVSLNFIEINPGQQNMWFVTASRVIGSLVVCYCILVMGLNRKKQKQRRKEVAEKVQIS